jgi:hypothetical protein
MAMTRLLRTIAVGLLVSLSGCGLFSTKDQPLSLTDGDKLPFGTGVYVVSCNTVYMKDGIEKRQVTELEVSLTETLEKGQYSYTALLRDPKLGGETKAIARQAFHEASPGIYILGVPEKPEGEQFFYYFIASTRFSPLQLSFDEASVERLARERGVVIAKQPYSSSSDTVSWALQGDREQERDFLLAVGRLPPRTTVESKGSCSISPKT